MTAAAVPPLRDDLRLYPAAAARDGSPLWSIHDPVTNRFFRVGWVEFTLLTHWALAVPEKIVAAARRALPVAVTTDDVDALARFLQAHQLARSADAEGVDRLARAAAARREGRLAWLLHHYLFFRIPLVRPQRFLDATWPAVSWFFSRTFTGLALVAMLAGVLLTARQWDEFEATFVDFLSIEGLSGYALALLAAKTLHELGHAYTARRHCVKVGHMGLAFLVMWPMLYTDTSDSWKLRDARTRFAIAFAGLRTELLLAGWATLGWALLDDGALRNGLFFLATTSWVLTLSINASPFMRFDGYFLLSDALDLPNLHERAFALARVTLRRALLGWTDPFPETFPPRLHRALVVFAWVTWLYRLVLFLGIAVAVYLFFFKLLGVLLFAVEVGWFVVRPVVAELRVWRARRADIVPGRAAAIFVLAALPVILLFVPWARDVSAPAWVHAREQQVLYSPLPGRVVSLVQDGPVAAGDPVAVMDAPELRVRAAQFERAARTLSQRVNQGVVGREYLERQGAFVQQVAEQLAEARARRAEIDRLVLRAPFSGRVVDADRAVGEGVWVNEEQPLALLLDDRAWVADVFVEQKALERIADGAQVRVYVDGAADAPLAGRVIGVDRTRVERVPDPMLLASHGGPLPVRETAAGESLRDALYRVRVQLDAPPARSAVLRGTARIAGQPSSLGLEWLRGAASVLVRESGF